MLRAKSAILVEAKHRKTTSTLVSSLASAILCTLFTFGCSSIPNTLGSSTSAPSPRNTVTSLPDGIVGTSYNSALSAIGGTSPFRFSVAQGELPSGLALNSQTGQISGTPTQAGSFNFKIALVSEPAPRGFREHGYNVTVRPCEKCVTLQITPLSPSVAPGGHIQFSAMLTDTGTTAVSWSASSGTISSTGLFTAPTTSASKPVVVKATSIAHQGVQAETSVSITRNTALVIQTARVPAAVSNEPYSAILTATGGHPPYTWTITSGSLPAGVKLNSTTGTLSGLPTRTGTFGFTVRGSDTKADTAQRTFSLAVSQTRAGCGPPTYNCSRTDLSTVQLPQTPPNVGNLIGANTIAVDPDFHNRIVRITDARTNPDPVFVNRTFVSSSSGSADDNLWNLDSTLFILQDTGTNGYPFSFDPSTMQASRLYVDKFPSTRGLMLGSGGVWSRVNPNVLYASSGTTISKYNFRDRTNPPTKQTVYQFKGSNCLPTQFSETWSVNGGVSGDDTAFGAAFSNTGAQGTGVFAVVYKVGSGCSVLNTQTGQVSGEWGTKGTINIPDRWTIHNVKLSKDGNWLIITPTACTSSPCSSGPYYWQVGTTNVTSCGQGGLCSGHWTEGYTHWVNCNNSPMANQVIRSFDVAASARSVGNDLPSGIVGPLDQHQSWNNVDPLDSVPFFSSTWSNRKPFPAPWYNEIIAVAPDGSGKTWRFAHTFITANSQRFSTQYAIGTVSQDGRFFIFSSDWMGSLGSESGTVSCTVGTNCRGDVFVLELK